MTAINNKIKPYSIKSLLYWNDFKMIRKNVYRRDFDNGIYFVEVDISEWWRYIEVSYTLKDDNCFLHNKSTVTIKPTNAYYDHNSVYEGLLGWMYCNVKNCNIPNFNKSERDVFCRHHFNEKKIKRWIRYRGLDMENELKNHISDTYRL